MKEKKNEFKISLEPFLETYGKDILNNFFRYWTEPNISKTKMRFEMEKTWDLHRRLKYWASNDKSFNKGIKQTEIVTKSILTFK